ncbi:MAG: ClpXP protease specificity-enhancing factor SspB [Pseudomonadota bacterium]|nr:ClpXP protease specificity-enhancing factor SspB [Pseudomonadota bacterium]
MTSNKPYLIRAMYDWLVANHVTPYILIDAFAPGVNLPDACHVDDDNCVLLNVSPDAVSELKLGITDIVFLASFNQTVYDVQFPVNAVRAIYCLDNGQGMYFDDDESYLDEGESEGLPLPDSSKKNKSPFKLVKKNTDEAQ